MYADKVTESMQKSIDETNRRRAIQQEYNEEHGIEPKTIIRNTASVLGQSGVSGKKGKKYYVDQEEASVAADPIVAYMDKDQLKKLASQTKDQMEKAAKDLDFMEAARLRDELQEIEKMLKK